jgi:hypothetical protein
MNETEIRNAIIGKATLSKDSHGCLSSWICLDYDGSGQSFGGYVLYLPKSFNHHKLESVAGHFIYRVLEIAGVDYWDELEGKTIRVKCDHSKVYEIGHIIKNDWFNPKEDFENI